MKAKKDAGSRKSKADQRPDGPAWRVAMHDVIFESDTTAGWVFDVALLIAILCSIAVVSIETIPSIAEKRLSFFTGFEWILTALFTVEYIARLSCARHPLRYAYSFWGIIDLLSVLPNYIGLFLLYIGVLLPDDPANTFVILRSIRLLRAFRVLKLWRMMNDADELSHAIWSARHKIIVFLIVVLVAVTISGTLMYFVENVVDRMIAGESLDENNTKNSQFDSIPQSMYWAVVTMTTVGYGDIVPKTMIGKFISAILILLGYSLIIVPSGFVTAELTSKSNEESDDADSQSSCPRCTTTGHRDGAVYCYQCGERLAAK
ncbi:MAG: ion transporter [Planctomycetales bacterium]|nr:ion transporter [Planctomycetales bacterium]